MKADKFVSLAWLNCLHAENAECMQAPACRLHKKQIFIAEDTVTFLFQSQAARAHYEQDLKKGT